MLSLGGCNCHWVLIVGFITLEIVSGANFRINSLNDTARCVSRVFSVGERYRCRVTIVSNRYWRVVNVLEDYAILDDFFAKCTIIYEGYL